MKDWGKWGEREYEEETDSRSIRFGSIRSSHSCRLRLRLSIVRRAAVWASGTYNGGRRGEVERRAAEGSVGEALEEDGSRAYFLILISVFSFAFSSYTHSTRLYISTTTRDAMHPLSARLHSRRVRALAGGSRRVDLCLLSLSRSLSASISRKGGDHIIVLQYTKRPKTY